MIGGRRSGRANGEAPLPACGVCLLPSSLPSVPTAQSTRWPEKSATGTKHKDQGQMMSCSRRESGKEGSPCHYYSAPSPSFSLIVRTIVFCFMLEREGGNKGEQKLRERGIEPLRARLVSKKFTQYPLYQIFRHIYEILNVVEKNN